MPVEAPPARRVRQGRWKVWTRTLHIYTSLLGLVLALFFGTTGFVLNHDDWFDLGTRKDTREGVLPAQVLEPLDPLNVVETLRADYGVQGALTTWELEPEELRLRFARPGEETDVVVQRQGGALQLTRERGGVLAALTDLHKGEHSGAVGGLLVDATSILLITISLSGFLLWLTLPKRRRLGLAALSVTLGLLGIFAGYVFL